MVVARLREGADGVVDAMSQVVAEAEYNDDVMGVNNHLTTVQGRYGGPLRTRTEGAGP